MAQAPPSSARATVDESDAAILASITVPSSSPRSRFVNWGLSFECTPLAIFEPETEEHCALVLAMARREGRVLKAVGVGHSPSDLVCTGDFMLRMTKMARLLEVNVEKAYVVAEVGITLTALHIELAKHGLAMRNVGSISDQTLGGIVTTASHGSGIGFASMSTDVSALTLLLADGSVAQCSRTEQEDLFLATLCGLGATGIILRIQLKVEPAFRLKEELCSRSFEDWVGNFESLVRSAEHVRFWWIAASHKVKCSTVNRTREPKLPPIPWFYSSFLAFHVVQLLLFIGRLWPYLNTLTGIFVSWLAAAPVTLVDDGPKIFNVECRYPQHTTEWAVPLANAPACLRELKNWMDSEAKDPHGLRPHFPFEVRFSKEDDIWLSPAYGRETCWIGIAQYRPYGFNVPYATFFKRYEAIVARHGGRPHWAKAHPLTPPQLRKMYPKFADFVRVLEEVDPHGVFRNEYVRRHVFGEEILAEKGEGRWGRVWKARRLL
ncbi:FAD-binding PCMH-type domain-containing protein [Mycena indigotica]|uniref:D-arabinono-1,4-lactone oxidase n=1 Tax=Mycena indigotica TaxID=2126181 RepID=A0A8H6WBF9_9AGAR|nr:FAD-binding PCMH-type domain-containing protein [Mycena indigotica]KAF7311777.1 FAD-binding PCMH-type domain-containing protein [Mycena indigotica]